MQLICYCIFFHVQRQKVNDEKKRITVSVRRTLLKTTISQSVKRITSARRQTTVILSYTSKDFFSPDGKDALNATPIWYRSQKGFLCLDQGV